MLPDRVRVGIFGLMSKDGAHPGLPLPDGCSADLRVLDPIETARKVVQELRPKVDIVICLAHLGLPAEKELAASVHGIDVIIGGRSLTPLPEPLKIGGTIIGRGGGHSLIVLEHKGVRANQEVLDILQLFCQCGRHAKTTGGEGDHVAQANS